jgi:hypothetical protein
LKKAGPIPKKGGPDIGSKSAWTCCQYCKLLSDQVDLDYCGFEPRNSVAPDMNANSELLSQPGPAPSNLSASEEGLEYDEFISDQVSKSEGAVTEVEPETEAAGFEIVPDVEAWLRKRK